MEDPRVSPALTRHVKGLWPELEDLFTAGEQVTDLTAHPGWLCVCAVIDREANSLMSGLDSSGEPKSQAEYARVHGRRGGLLAIREALLAIQQVADETRAKQVQKHERGGESPRER